MTLCVLDTGTALAWYLPESFSESARDWQTKMLAATMTFVVPSLHFWEFGNVLRTYVRRQEIDRDVARDIFELHLDAPLDLKEPDRRTVLDTALAYDATVYDAVYISLALTLDIRLLTAEKSTTPWVVKLGDRIVSVR